MEIERDTSNEHLFTDLYIDRIEPTLISFFKERGKTVSVTLPYGKHPVASDASYDIRDTHTNKLLGTLVRIKNDDWKLTLS